MDDIIIVGFGGHAKSVADSIIRSEKYNIAGYTDKKKCDCDFHYLGTDDELKKLHACGIDKAVLGVGFMGNSFVRDLLAASLTEIGFELPAIIDPSAIIARDAVIGEGSFIGKNTVVNADSHVGQYCIINTGAIVEHENIIGDYSHIAVGAVLCGNVIVGKHSFIGANTAVIQGITIGKSTVVGAGSVVNENLPDNCTAVGIPAKIIKNRDRIDV